MSDAPAADTPSDWSRTMSEPLDHLPHRPDWAQGMLVLPDLIAVDLRLWVSSNRGRWSLATTVSAGVEHDLVAMHVGPERPFSTLDPILVASTSAIDRQLRRFVAPFPHNTSA